jgi:hypothetical protein
MNSAMSYPYTYIPMLRVCVTIKNRYGELKLLYIYIYIYIYKERIYKSEVIYKK